MRRLHGPPGRQATRSCVTRSAVPGRDDHHPRRPRHPEKPNALQAAFIAEQAAQCGYCTNGMIMAAKSLLDRRLRIRRSNKSSKLLPKPLPVRHPHADSARGDARGEGEEAPWKPHFVSRRDLLKSGGALVVSFALARRCQGGFAQARTSVGPTAADRRKPRPGSTAFSPSTPTVGDAVHQPGGRRHRAAHRVRRWPRKNSVFRSNDSPSSKATPRSLPIKAEPAAAPAFLAAVPTFARLPPPHVRPSRLGADSSSAGCRADGRSTAGSPGQRRAGFRVATLIGAKRLSLKVESQGAPQDPGHL